MEILDFSAIIVASVAAFGAWAAQRSAAKANKANLIAASRIEAERGAYERALSFDVGTIERQEAEIIRLRTDNHDLHVEIDRLRERIVELERKLNEKA